MMVLILTMQMFHFFLFFLYSVDHISLQGVVVKLSHFLAAAAFPLQTRTSQA
jgi:hypothetical protein